MKNEEGAKVNNFREGSKSLWMEMWLLKELQLWLRCHHTRGKGLSQRRGLGDGKELAGTSHLPDAPGQEMPSSLFPGSGQGRRISWSSCRNQCLQGWWGRT